MALAKQLLGRQAYVGWPHLVEAKIHSLSDGTNHYQVCMCVCCVCVCVYMCACVWYMLGFLFVY